jgi:hypothetical protein
MQKVKYEYSNSALIGMIAHAQTYLSRYPEFSTESASCTATACTAVCKPLFSQLYDGQCFGASGQINSSAVCYPLGTSWTANCAACQPCGMVWWASAGSSGEGTVVPNAAPTFVSTTGVGAVAATDGVADKYVVPVTGLYDRVGTNSSEHKYDLWRSNAAADGRYAALSVRKGYDASSTIMSDIFQTLVSRDMTTKTARTMAFNQVQISYSSDSSGSLASRAILLVSFVNKKFVIKSREGTGYLIVAGSGGFDFSTGLWLEGAYMARVLGTGDGDSEQTVCVDSKTQLVKGIGTDATECQAIAGFFTDSASFDMGDYLGLNAQEKTDMAGYLAFFANDTALTAEQTPMSSDDQKHFADSVH